MKSLSFMVAIRFIYERRRKITMHYQDWLIIDALYKNRNITKTAEELYVSQPALTSRIKKIEEFYNTPLITRNNRGVHFTMEGELLAVKAKEMIRNYAEIQSELDNLKENVTGTLRIGVSNFIAKYKIPKILKMFKELFPLIECYVVTGWSKDIHKMVNNKDIHFGFIRGSYPWNGEKKLLFEENICVAADFDFNWEDLPSLPRIDYGTDHILRPVIEEWWRENYKQPSYVGIHVDHVDTCKEMIVNGLGYGIVPTLILKDYPHINKKVIIDHKGNPLKRKTWLYYNNDDMHLRVCKEFKKFILNLDIGKL